MLLLKLVFIRRHLSLELYFIIFRFLSYSPLILCLIPQKESGNLKTIIYIFPVNLPIIYPRYSQTVYLQFCLSLTCKNIIGICCLFNLLNHFDTVICRLSICNFDCSLTIKEWKTANNNINVINISLECRFRYS